MLGRLLSTAMSSQTKSTLIDNEAEESHTRALLYRTNSTNGSNCAGESLHNDIRDVRFIIAQDSVHGDPKLTMYDSNPATPHIATTSRRADNPPVPGQR